MRYLSPTACLVSVKQKWWVAGKADQYSACSEEILSQSLICEQVHMSEEETGWNQWAADQQYQVGNVNAALRFSCFLWPRHAHPSPLPPTSSVTEQLWRKQTERQWSVNDAEVFSILRWGGSGLGFGMPRASSPIPDALPLSDMLLRSSALWISNQQMSGEMRHRRPCRGAVMMTRMHGQSIRSGKVELNQLSISIMLPCAVYLALERLAF